MGIIAWIVFGFIVGLIARAIVPGRQSMGFILTTLLGVAGSIVGGLVATGLSGGSPYDAHPVGFLGSLLGAIVLLLLGSFATRSRRRVV
jgi:uncharacterized membrane protein YeaQ/YmgE (transglycosylase-associated protein family)